MKITKKLKNERWLYHGSGVSTNTLIVYNFPHGIAPLSVLRRGTGKHGKTLPTPPLCRRIEISRYEEDGILLHEYRADYFPHLLSGEDIGLSKAQERAIKTWARENPRKKTCIVCNSSMVDAWLATHPTSAKHSLKK